MTSMTCEQLGGPCGHLLTGATADEIIKQQDQHLKQSVKDGDGAHQQAHREMKQRWKHPKQSLGWYVETKRAFRHLSEAQAVNSPRDRIRSRR